MLDVRGQFVRYLGFGLIEGVCCGGGGGGVAIVSSSGLNIEVLPDAYSQLDNEDYLSVIHAYY